MRPELLASWLKLQREETLRLVLRAVIREMIRRGWYGWVVHRVMDEELHLLTGVEQCPR